MPRYKGFSTIGRVKPPYTLLDGDLVKRDLLNEFYTRLGERPMRPTFGSIIWDLLMEPSTPELEDAIREDVKKIIDRDPRAELLNNRMIVLDHTIRVEIDLRFVATSVEDTLFLEYKRKITEGID
jgi:phage baseplate assembly protein W